MSNVSDYLKWRGDLDFSQAPFNDVDNLILAQIAYVDFTDIVPAPGSIETITIAEAADTFFDTHDEKEIKKCKSFIGKAPYLLREAAATKRFGSLILTNYVDYVDGGKEEQFAAFHVRIDNRLTYIAFRGTDDTLVGWKEDFNMAFLPVIPSQADAADYVTKLGKSFPGKLLLMGHSKGGNLAAYAGMFCDPEIQKRIERVYPLDSPGFIGNTLESEEYGRIQSRVHKVIPKGSLIGMLLENHGAYSVVESNQMGIMQHDPFSWQVTDGAFHTLEEISSGAKYMNKTLNSWITGMSIDERIRLVDVLYGLLTAGNIENVFDAGDIQKNIGAIYNAAVHLDPETRSFVLQIIRQLAGFALHNIPHPNVPENLNILPGNKTQN